MSKALSCAWAAQVLALTCAMAKVGPSVGPDADVVVRWFSFGHGVPAWSLGVALATFWTWGVAKGMADDRS